MKKLCLLFILLISSCGFDEGNAAYSSIEVPAYGDCSSANTFCVENTICWWVPEGRDVFYCIPECTEDSDCIESWFCADGYVNGYCLPNQKE